MALVAFVLYTPALSGPFIYDDLPYVRDNASIRDPRNLAQLWTTPYPPARPELGCTVP